MSLRKNKVVNSAAAIGVIGCYIASNIASASALIPNNINLNRQEIKAIQTVMDKSISERNFNINNSNTLVTSIDGLLGEKFKLSPLHNKGTKNGSNKNSNKKPTGSPSPAKTNNKINEGKSKHKNTMHKSNSQNNNKAKNYKVNHNHKNTPKNSPLLNKSPKVNVHKQSANKPNSNVAKNNVKLNSILPNTPAFKCQVSSGDNGLKPWLKLVRTRIMAQFNVSEIGGYRPGDPQDHGKGLALDVMVPVKSKKGDDVAAWAIKNNKELKVKYVIWKQRIWLPNDPNNWRAMEDRGSITENHYDHVHISFYDAMGTCPSN